MAQRTIVELLIEAKDKTAAAFASVSSKIKGITSNLLSMKTAVVGFVAAVSAGIVGKIVGAFGEQEDAVVRLNAALRSTGRYSDEGSRQIQAMSGEIQKMTTYADEAVLATTATIAQLAKELTPAQLAETQKAVVGLADTFGLDLQSAAVLVGKALAGERDVLARYGIALKDGGTQQEKFNILMRATSGFYQVSMDSTQGLIGSFKQLKNAGGELMETFGQIIVESFNVGDEQKKLKDRVLDLNAQIQEHMGTWVKWGRVVWDVVVLIGRSLWAAVKLAYDTGKSVGAAFNAIIYGAGYGWDKLINAITDKINAFGNGAIDIVNNIILKINHALGTRIPTISLSFNIPRIDEEADYRQVLISMDDFASAGEDMQAQLNGVREAWGTLWHDMNARPLPRSAFDYSTRGGGANITPPKPPPAPPDYGERVKNLAADMELLQKRWEAGRIGGVEYADTIIRLKQAMEDLMGTGQLTSEQQVKLLDAWKGLGDQLREIGTVPEREGKEQLTFWQKVAESLGYATDDAEAFNKVLADITASTITQFGAAVSDAFEAFVDGSKSAGQAFEAGMLGAIASVATGLGQLYVGRAVAELAEGIAAFPLGGQHFAAAAKFTAAAMLLFAVGGALKGVANRVGGGGGGGAAGAAQSTTQAATKQTAYIYIEGGILDMSDPRQADALAAALRNLTGRNVVIQRGGTK